MNDEAGRNPAITRRSLLLLGGGCLMAGVLAQPAVAGGRLVHERTLSLEAVHTGEKWQRVYWAEGRYIPQALREVHYLLRDHRTDEVKVIDVRLLDLLHDMHSLMDNRTSFEIVSGYRSAATNKQLQRTNPDVARHSYHTQGMAIDIRQPGRDLVKLKAAALRLNRGGIGSYPQASFLHVDVGPRRRW
ncbi:MAG: twin-arginine translocation pathway signal [Rhodospirillaceae bacterium]|nr:MAG: twin-arginine translocation pathway signal [Rhodospirillaceae bacterium]